MKRGLCLPILLSLISTAAWSQADDNSRNLTAEYGLSYHVINGKDNSNGSSGQFTSKMGPYWRGAWSHRLTENWGYRLAYKFQLVEFNDVEGGGDVKQEKEALHSAEVGLSWMQTPIRRMTFFYRQRDRILYKAKDNDVFELVKHGFGEPGLEVAWGNRRRVGPQISFALQGFVMLPTSVKGIDTGTGYGAEAALRAGWITPLGVSVMIKGFYDYGAVPNSTLNFVHEEFGYALQMTYSF